MLQVRRSRHLVSERSERRAPIMSETTAQDVADRGFEPAKRAQSLIEALPYIDRFRGAVIVVKFGGNAMVDPELSLSLIHI